MMGNQFTRTQLLEQAEKMKIKPNTALSWLNRLIKKDCLSIQTIKAFIRARMCACVREPSEKVHFLHLYNNRTFHES